MHTVSGSRRFPALAHAALVATLALGAFDSALASPVPLIQTRDFGPGAAVNFAFNPFDAELGTLERAQLEFFGTVSASFVPLPNAVNGIGTPYVFTGTIAQSFEGGGAFSSFGFSNPATFISPALVADGLGSPVTVASPFSWFMDFAANSDLLGFVLPTFSGATVPPVAVDGRRADFVGSAGSSDLTLFGTVSAQTGGAVLSGFATMSGGARLTYWYQPASTPTAVPEPGTAGLLLLALAGGVLVRARRRLPVATTRR